MAEKIYPEQMSITLSNGKTIDLQFTGWKPSRKSGKDNANAIGKFVIDGRMVQIGCNVTAL